MKLTLKITMLLASQVVLTLRALAQAPTAPDKWVPIEDYSDSAGPLADAMGKKLTAKLTAQKSKTVFIALTSCTAPDFNARGLLHYESTKEGQKVERDAAIAQNTQAWCQSFETSLVNFLINQGIRFLPEANATKVREAIGREQVYQYTSMQVSTDKAVELGKQQAFQAFISVDVIRSGPNKVRANATSVNIAEGVIDISEHADQTIKSQVGFPTSTIIASFSLVGIGATLAAVNDVRSRKAKKDGDAAYSDYRAAKSSEEAASARRRAETADTIRTSSNQLVKLGWYCIGGAGVYAWLMREQQLSFQLNAALSVGPESNPVADGAGVQWAPVLLENSVGLIFSYNY